MEGDKDCGEGTPRLSLPLAPFFTCRFPDFHLDFLQFHEFSIYYDAESMLAFNCCLLSLMRIVQFNAFDEAQPKPQAIFSHHSLGLKAFSNGVPSMNQSSVIEND